MSKIIAIADAVVAQLNGAAFSQPVTAERHYLPRFDLADMTELKVSVVPRGLVSQGLDRGKDTYDYQVDVAVQKKSSLVESELDALMALVEEVADLLRKKRLTALPEVICVQVKNDPVYAPEHLDELRKFTSVLTFTYRAWR